MVGGPGGTGGEFKKENGSKAWAIANIMLNIGPIIATFGLVGEDFHKQFI
jgi:hypothetical protein